MRQAKIGAVITTHVWDGANIVADIEGGSVTTYLRGVNLIASVKGSTKNYYLYNAHGDVVLFGSRAYRYDAFGNELTSNANDANPFRYAGEYFDGETETYYLRARYYEPKTGRFSSEDPIRDGLNFYTYCSNNPIKFIDPSGLVMVLVDYIMNKINGLSGDRFSYKTTEYNLFKLNYYKILNVTIGNRTFNYRYEEIGGIPVVDSDYLVRDFGISRDLVEHQVGDIFSEMNHAALAWSLKYWPVSNSEQREYGAYIYGGANGGYFFDTVSIGESTGVKPPDINPNFTVAAGIHTHPSIWYYFFNEGELFSEFDQNVTRADTLLQGKTVPLYVATPNGNLKMMWYESTNGEYPVSTIYSYNPYWVNYDSSYMQWH